MSWRWCWIWCCLWLLSHGVQATQSNAEAAYRQQDYALATQEWQQRLQDPALARASAEHSRLAYNLGNAAYRSDQKLIAVGWYTIALQGRPRDAATWANLELARSECGLEPWDRGDLAATVGRVLGSWTPAEAGWIALGGLLGLALACAMEALRGGRAGRILLLLGLGLFLLTLSPLILVHGRDQRPQVMCVERAPLVLRSEPREEAASLADWAPGSTAVLLDQLPDWCKLELPSGEVGWVLKTGVFELSR